MSREFPESIEQAMQMALQRYQSEEPSEAETLCRRILSEQPAHPGALQLLGILASETGRPDVAAALIGRAIGLQPGNAELHSNLGMALQAAGRLPEAVAAHQQAARLAPDHAEVHFRLGVACQAAGRPNEAVTAYRQALSIDPRRREARNNLGTAYDALGRFDEAISAYRLAIELEPDYVAGYYNLGRALHAKGEVDAAAESFRKVIALDPGHVAAHNGLGNCDKDCGRIEEAIACYRKAADLDPSKSDWRSNVIYTTHFQANCEPMNILAESLEWDRRFGQPLKAGRRRHGNDREPERRLRIGYVSPDFNRHVVGRSIAPLLREHDRAHSEIFCYADVLAPDAVTNRLRSCADGWRDIAGVSDEEAEEMIRADGIDILIDLTAHMARNRLRLFARKPAPVQATYLGYCSTTGLEAMDYRLSDPHLDPPGSDLGCYRERTIWLPRTYWCYDPSGPAPDISALPAARNGFVTFACWNNLAKASADAVTTWMAILRRTAPSRLRLHAPAGHVREQLRRRAEEHGVASDRVEFVGMQSWERYMESYGQVDVGLDPFPYAGGVTTLDALWMGVPVVSLSGRLAVGRGGRGILTNVGLPELAAESPEQYVELAVRLAEDLPRLSALRASLRERMARSPLCDSKGFARDFEAACRTMWRDWCAGQSSAESK
jgi:protein O-GlcNAc transferase